MFKNLYLNPQKNAYLLILFVAIFSTIYNAFMPIHYDEAYYWMWSHHLQGGYYDHPPMVAYLIYLTNFISESVWGVGLVGVLTMSVTAIYIFKLTKLLSDEKTALNGVIIFLSVILTHAGYIIITPDDPLIMFWALSLYYGYLALFTNKRKYFVLLGLFLGAMMLSKYPAILFVFTLLLFVIIKKRELFLTLNFYITVVLSAIVVSPLIIWNYQHEWISFLFQLHHGTTQTFEISPYFIFEFMVAQFGVFSPVFAYILFYYLIKNKLFIKDEKMFFISLSVVVILLFFLYKAFYMSMSPAYGAPAYVGGAVLTAIFIKQYNLQKLFKVGLIVALVFTILGRVVFFFFYDYNEVRMIKNKEAIEILNSYKKDGDMLYGNHLTTAALITYYTKGHPDSDVITDSRYSQYDMWRGKDYIKNGLVLSFEPVEKDLKTKYKNVTLLRHLKYKRHFLDKYKQFYIYRVEK